MKKKIVDIFFGNFFFLESSETQFDLVTSKIIAEYMRALTLRIFWDKKKLATFGGGEEGRAACRSVGQGRLIISRPVYSLYWTGLNRHVS